MHGLGGHRAPIVKAVLLFVFAHGIFLITSCFWSHQYETRSESVFEIVWIVPTQFWIVRNQLRTSDQYGKLCFTLPPLRKSSFFHTTRRQGMHTASIALIEYFSFKISDYVFRGFPMQPLPRGNVSRNTVCSSIQADFQNVPGARFFNLGSS